MVLVERAATWLAAACAFMAQILYAVHFYRPHFQSDDAVLNMVAEAMREQGSLLPHGWITNNGDLMLPSGAMFVAPLLSWIPNGFHAHAIAGVFAIVVMLLAFVWLLRQRIGDGPVLAIAAAVCMSGVSWYCAHVIYQQTTYFWWTAAFFVGAALIWKSSQVRQRGNPSPWLGFALFLLVFTICLANPSRMAIMFILPLYAFDRALSASNGSGPGGLARRWLRRFGVGDGSSAIVLGLGFLVSATAYAWLIFSGRVETVHNASSLHWAGWTAVLDHACLFMEGWLPLLGVTPSGLRIQSGFLAAVLEWGRLWFALWLTWVAAHESLTVHRQKDRFRRALTFAFLAGFVPIFALYIFLSPLAVDLSTMRYFTVPLFILVALAAVRVADAPYRKNRVMQVAMVVACVMVSFTSLQRFVFYSNQPISDFWRIVPSRTMLLADVLKREGLKWGYATWWNAGAATVASEGSVRVNAVTLESGEVRPFPFMVQKAWYDPSSWEDETFLAVSVAEASEENLRGLQASLGTPSRVVDAPFHKILVYDHNIIGRENLFSMSMKLDADRAMIDIVAVEPELVADGRPTHVLVTLANESRLPVSGVGAYPISIGLRLLDSAGIVRDPDWVHSPLTDVLEPGMRRSYNVGLPVIPNGRWTVQVDLVQEGVAWFHQWGKPMASFVVPVPEPSDSRGIPKQ